MEELMSKMPMWLEAMSVILSAVVVLATAVARLTPSKKDDVAVGKVRKVVDKVLHWLPTIGVNPQTKELKKKEGK